MTDYTWKVARSLNPKKAWLVEARTWTKLSALMSVASAERIAIAHNMAIKFIQAQLSKDTPHAP